MVLVVVACTSKETVYKKIVLPKDIPNFVKESDFEKIDWERKAVKFGDSGIIGNANKSGVIGADMPSLNTQKWMWHIWGMKDVDLTVVGLHRETKTVHPILFDRDKESWYWTNRMMGAVNGADSHMPSSVKVPKSGEWAILLYTDGKLFDKLIFEINE